jgi:hypothetical protein
MMAESLYPPNLVGGLSPLGDDPAEQRTSLVESGQGAVLLAEIDVGPSSSGDSI